MSDYSSKENWPSILQEELAPDAPAEPVAELHECYVCGHLIHPKTLVWGAVGGTGEAYSREAMHARCFHSLPDIQPESEDE